MTPPLRIHATAVAIGGHGVLLLGGSGAGKSDLALRLIDRGALLVSDDQTNLTTDDGSLLASPPNTIAGLIEVRGIGIVTVAHRASARVALLVRLEGEVPRMPDKGLSEEIAGVRLPVMTVDPAAMSAPIKVELALRLATEGAT
ncbi:HPr kinase/phosphorylase [Sphingomonas immobilis]|uniref:Aldolase n=1 Tax=Sphingomonas immobilis TaxID=3063997 RepID=A0ABT8ZYU8_9SPHN|nr:aldolase [Sphingomonas sp. CA1-15]MDO7842760.1 aldolase [Sphingomonas sp. CA1-15]